jgi:glycosyltransferase involved in cell wall biosynthesis
LSKSIPNVRYRCHLHVEPGKLLDETLARLQELHIPEGVIWELLVVNNCCTDNTDEVISRHGARLPLRRLHEPRPGLSNARNCALGAARGDLLIWTDDDVLVDSRWLEEYVRAAHDWPEAAFFGGTVNPWFPKAPPRWILQNLTTLLYSAYASSGPPAMSLSMGQESSRGGASCACTRGNGWSQDRCLGLRVHCV